MSFLGNVFSFLNRRPQAEELVAEHVVREHHRGRAVAEIVKDDYVTNRATPEQIARALERPDVLAAIADDDSPSAS